MNNLTKTSKFVILAVVVVVIVGLVVIYGGGSGAPATQTSSGTPTTTATGNTPAPTSTNNKPPTGGTGTTPSKPSGGTGSTAPTAAPIALITPVPSDSWKIGDPNIVQWAQEAGVAGEIDLLNAATKVLVGVISPSTGPHQTSYTWNTRDMFQGPGSPVKTTVVPGSYIIRIVFPNSHVATILSKTFNITN